MSFVAAVFLIFLVIGGALGAVAYFVYRQKLRKAKAIERGLKMVPILIHLPPRSDDTSGGSRDVKDVMREKTAQAEVLYNLLAGTATDGFRSTFYGQRHIALELIASEGLVHFYAAVPVALVSTIEKAIQTAYPGARLEMAEDHNIFNQEGRLAATLGGEMILRTDSAYPIATYAKLDRDPMEALLTSISALEKADGVAFQLMVRPATPNWIARSLRLVDMKRRGSRGGSITPRDLVKAVVKAPSQSREEDRAKLGSQHELTNLQQSEIESIEEKTKHPGFEVLIRVIVSTSSVARSQQLIRDIATTFALYDSPGLNGFTFLPAVDVQGLVTAFIFRFFPPELKGNVLNSVELATLFHLPDAQFTPTSSVARQLSKQVDGPTKLPSVGLLFGYNEFRGVKKEIRLSPDDRRRHTYILGQTGTGKSTMLENLAVQDMLSGNGFAFIDPHGDSAEKLLAMVPKNRTEDVIYFNPADTQYPLGLNLFEFTDPTQKDFLVQETINMLYKLYDPGHTGIIGPRYEHWYRNAALTLMSDPNGATFIEIPKVFTDTEYLKRKFKYLKDPTVIDFWTKEMGQTSDYHKSEMLGWFVSKFGAFQNNEMMRNIIGQTKSAFNLREIMDQKKILIVNLSKGQVGELNSQLLGMMFVIKFQAAAMSRANVTEDQRPDFSLYVDEFQNFSTDSFSSILSEARKYRLNLIVANQFIGQLSNEIRDAVFGNIGTIVAHRMGPEDADFMVKQFAPVFDASDLMNLPNYNAAVRLMIGGLPSQPFTMLDSPPLGKPNLELGLAVKQLSAAKYGHEKAVVEADIMGRLTGEATPAPAIPAPATATPAIPAASAATPAPVPAPAPASAPAEATTPAPMAAVGPAPASAAASAPVPAVANPVPVVPAEPIAAAAAPSVVPPAPVVMPAAPVAPVTPVMPVDPVPATMPLDPAPAAMPGAVVSPTTSLATAVAPVVPTPVSVASPAAFGPMPAPASVSPMSAPVTPEPMPASMPATPEPAAFVPAMPEPVPMPAIGAVGAGPVMPDAMNAPAAPVAPAPVAATPSPMDLAMAADMSPAAAPAVEMPISPVPVAAPTPAPASAPMPAATSAPVMNSLPAGGFDMVGSTDPIVLDPEPDTLFAGDAELLAGDMAQSAPALTVPATMPAAPATTELMPGEVTPPPPIGAPPVDLHIPGMQDEGPAILEPGAEAPLPEPSPVDAGGPDVSVMAEPAPRPSDAGTLSVMDITGGRPLPQTDSALDVPLLESEAPAQPAAPMPEPVVQLGTGMPFADDPYGDIDVLGDFSQPAPVVAEVAAPAEASAMPLVADRANYDVPVEPAQPLNPINPVNPLNQIPILASEPEQVASPVAPAARPEPSVGPVAAQRLRNKRRRGQMRADQPVETTLPVRPTTMALQNGPDVLQDETAAPAMAAPASDISAASSTLSAMPVAEPAMAVEPEPAPVIEAVPAAEVAPVEAPAAATTPAGNDAANFDPTSLIHFVDPAAERILARHDIPAPFQPEQSDDMNEPEPAVNTSADMPVAAAMPAAVESAVPVAPTAAAPVTTPTSMPAMPAAPLAAMPAPAVAAPAPTAPVAPVVPAPAPTPASVPMVPAVPAPMAAPSAPAPESSSVAMPAPVSAPAPAPAPAPATPVAEAPVLPMTPVAPAMPAASAANTAPSLVSNVEPQKTASEATLPPAQAAVPQTMAALTPAPASAAPTSIVSAAASTPAMPATAPTAPAPMPTAPAPAPATPSPTVPAASSTPAVPEVAQSSAPAAVSKPAELAAPTVAEPATTSDKPKVDEPQVAEPAAKPVIEPAKPAAPSAPSVAPAPAALASEKPSAPVTEVASSTPAALTVPQAAPVVPATSAEPVSQNKSLSDLVKPAAGSAAPPQLESVAQMLDEAKMPVPLSKADIKATAQPTAPVIKTEAAEPVKPAVSTVTTESQKSASEEEAAKNQVQEVQHKIDSLLSESLIKLDGRKRLAEPIGPVDPENGQELVASTETQDRSAAQAPRLADHHKVVMPPSDMHNSVVEAELAAETKTDEPTLPKPAEVTQPKPAMAAIQPEKHTEPAARAAQSTEAPHPVVAAPAPIAKTPTETTPAKPMPAQIKPESKPQPAAPKVIQPLRPINKPKFEFPAIVKHGGGLLPEPAPTSDPLADDTEYGVPQAESLAADDVARARAEREAERKLNLQAETAEKPAASAAAPAHQAAQPSQSAQAAVQPSRHRLRRHERPAEQVASPEEAAHNRPTEAQVQAAPLAGKLIMPTAAKQHLKLEPVHPIKPKTLAPGEVFVDEKGNVIVGE